MSEVPENVAQDFQRIRYFCSGAAAVYLVVAIVSGMAMARAIPALNGLGAVYIGATWPIAMFCAASQLDGCSALPPPGSPLANAFFTFEAATP